MKQRKWNAVTIAALLHFVFKFERLTAVRSLFFSNSSGPFFFKVCVFIFLVIESDLFACFQPDGTYNRERGKADTHVLACAYALQLPRGCACLQWGSKQGLEAAAALGNTGFKRPRGGGVGVGLEHQATAAPASISYHGTCHPCMRITSTGNSPNRTAISNHSDTAACTGGNAGHEPQSRNQHPEAA